MKDLYYVIGYPVKHSLSPKIQMELAYKHKQNILFRALEIEPKHLLSEIQKLKDNPRVKGLSVTVPHKETIFAISDSADETAKDVKAASNVIFTDDRKMIALNYDGLGIVNDIKNNLKYSFENKKVLVIGAGGAAKAIVAAIINEKPSLLAITNRTKEKAIAIKDLFAYKTDIHIEDYENISGSYDIIINSTSASISNTMLPITKTNFSEDGLGYDLMYAENGTIFTQWCKKNHIATSDGRGMLQELSKAVFAKWRNL